jgi:hypothetical protein
MKKSRISVGLIVAVALLAASAAHAQATRTWVSGVGDDANPCSRTAPCKTFAGAISKTAAGGEISVLDPGGFGGVTITKPITISGDGTLAGILVSGAGVNGVVVNAAANDRVILRNLSIIGAGTASNAIRFIAGKSLLVDNVTIAGFINRGIDVEHPSSGSLQVKNTTITQGSTNSTLTGIRLNAVGAVLFLANIEDSNLQELNNGIEVVANSRALITNSIISSNASNGILANSGSAVINAEGCTIAFNGLNGVNGAVSGSNIRLSNNQIYNNTTGVTFVAGATVASAANNRIFANGASLAPNAVITIQ